MKVIIRATIVVGVLNLAMAVFVLAQGAVVETVDAAAVEAGEPVSRVQGLIAGPAASQLFVNRGRIAGRGRGSRVLVIPTEEAKPEQLAQITQDLRVMSHIFDKKVNSPKYTGDVFVDFGDFFSRDKAATQAIYLEGYGLLFLMSVNFPLSGPPKAEEEQGKEAKEPVDTEWHQAQDELFSGKRRTTSTKSGQAEVYDSEKLEEFKKDLVKVLKHVANIRNLKENEWIIVTVSGGGQQGSEMFIYEMRKQIPSGLSPSDTGGGYVGSYGFGGGAGGGVAVGGGTMGFGGEGVSRGTVMTIRAKKSDVDDFAKGKLNFEEFQEKVKILTY